MLAKSWKKICLIILIIACLWNIVWKFACKISYNKVVEGIENEYKQEQTNTTKV